MNLIKSSGIAMLILFMTTIVSCKKDPAVTEAKFTIDSLQISTFFDKHPDFDKYQKDVTALYKKQNYKYVWYDEDGRNDVAEVLYDKVNQIGLEGVAGTVPYKKELDKLFDKDRKKPNLDNELLISSMYFFYADKVYNGLDPQQSKQMGWYLPRDKKPLVEYLEELMDDTDKLKKDEDAMYSMYYNLRTALKRYREIRDKGGWGIITLPEGVKSLKPGDDSPAIAQLRKRLFIGGDLKSDNGSSVYDNELVEVVKRWQREQHVIPDGLVGPGVVSDLNVPVEYRIKTILVNMERCRWLSPDIDVLKEYISVNIPSFNMQYFRDGDLELESNVVVGKELNKTVIFSGKMSYLVFSPYWNIPKSIIEQEIQPGINANPNYLEQHNMEWNDGNVRQKPGANNSLGLVKFMFPNSNNIYLHDTPAKSLFKQDDRALSHGCVRVEKARELAIRILQDDSNWSVAKIDEAMNAGVEKNYSLKKKIPVYLVYFTALADERGHVSFYNDIYKRDEKLAAKLYSE